MVISKKWKMVGGTVSAAVLFGSGIAGADMEDAPGRIALDDRVQMSDAATVTVESVGTSLRATIRQIAEREDQDSLSSPFDGADDDGADDDAVDTIDDPDSVDSPADDSVDSPADDSVDSPESVDSPDSVDSADSVDSPDSPDSVDSADSVDSPDDDDSVDGSDDD